MEASDQEQEFLDALSQRIWEARRQGAIYGAIYALSIASLIYAALMNLGPLDPVSALFYGGAVVLALDCYRRIFRRI